MKTRLALVMLAVLAAPSVLAGCRSDPVVVAIPAYDECDPSFDQCEPGTGCFTVSVDGATAGLCTDFCGSAADCPRDARGVRGECISFDGGSSFECFERCVDSADCAAGWACTTAAGGQSFPPICLPI